MCSHLRATCLHLGGLVGRSAALDAMGWSEQAKKRHLIEQRLQDKLRKETDSVRRAEEAKKDKTSANRKEEELQLRDSIVRLYSDYTLIPPGGGATFSALTFRCICSINFDGQDCPYSLISFLLPTLSLLPTPMRQRRQGRWPRHLGQSRHHCTTFPPSSSHLKKPSFRSARQR